MKRKEKKKKLSFPNPVFDQLRPNTPSKTFVSELLSTLQYLSNKCYQVAIYQSEDVQQALGFVKKMRRKRLEEFLKKLNLIVIKENILMKYTYFYKKNQCNQVLNVWF